MSIAGLALIMAVCAGGAGAEPAIAADSGHHYSWIEGAQIGHDFGRNPFASRSSDAASLGFDTTPGRSRLRASTQAAVGAGEGRMSFDLGFDFRSVVTFEDGIAVGLDEWAIRSIDAFLEELTSAHRLAQSFGRTFSADVVLVDHAVADGVSQEGAFTVGEHPELVTDASARAALLDVLAPVLSRLVAHPNVTINLMNEPEFVGMSAIQPARTFGRDAYRGVALADPAGDWIEGRQVGAALKRAAATVRVSRREGRITLSQSEITSADLQAFLLDWWRAVHAAAEVKTDFNLSGAVGFGDFLIFATCFNSTPSAPLFLPECDLNADDVIDFADFTLFAAEYGRVIRDPNVTIGWADDLSALANTPLLEGLAGEVVTDVDQLPRV